MLVRPGTFRNHTSPALKAWVDTLRTFNANGYDGFILDAGDISTLNQVSTGTTPVTAVTQPIGLMLDKHLGLQLGPELIAPANATLGAGWSRSGGEFTTDGTTGITEFIGVLTTGKWYKYTATISGGNLNLYLGSSTYVLNVTGTISWMGVCSGVHTNVMFQNTTAGAKTISNISVKLLEGNHALQATAAARPTWQVDANGYHLARFLGTDDSLSCATGGGGSTGFLFCCALKPTGGAGTLRTIYSDTGTNTGYKVQRDVNNKLSFSAGNGAAYTVLASTVTSDVGTKNYLTAIDDGTNLNVQIGSAAAETVARPVVSAGTAGFTIGKDNGAASSFLIDDFYRAVYIKNWAGTAAELAAIQSWVKAGAGL